MISDSRQTNSECHLAYYTHTTPSELTYKHAQPITTDNVSGSKHFPTTPLFHCVYSLPLPSVPTSATAPQPRNHRTPYLVTVTESRPHPSIFQTFHRLFTMSTNCNDSANSSNPSNPDSSTLDLAQVSFSFLFPSIPHPPSFVLVKFTRTKPFTCGAARPMISLSSIISTTTRDAEVCRVNKPLVHVFRFRSCKESGFHFPICQSGRDPILSILSNPPCRAARLFQETCSRRSC